MKTTGNLNGQHVRGCQARSALMPEEAEPRSASLSRGIHCDEQLLSTYLTPDTSGVDEVENPSHGDMKQLWPCSQRLMD